MKHKILSFILGFAGLAPLGAWAAPPAPLVLVHRYDLPASIKGHFDHFELDPAGKRLFGTAVDSHYLVVFNFGTGKVIKLIPLEIPRGVVYRADLERLYVTDGAGWLRIYDSRTYMLLKSLKMEVDADPIAYDPDTGRIFAVNGGEKAGHPYSHVTVFDSVNERQIGNVELPGNDLEDFGIEDHGSRLFVNDEALNQIDVINMRTLKPTTVWTLTLASENFGAAIDERTHRLFVACRKGGLLVLDSDTGRQLQTLPIGGDTDYIAFDAASRRIYVSGGSGHGWVDVYKEEDANHYRLLGEVTTEPHAATSHLAAPLGEYIVMTPSAPSAPAQVWVYKIASAD
ncbi:MAG TPA: YncE family protein [Steroidobacteraceae bacterium]|jgi:DNA-binding beta-propeller fold protein YncE